MYQLARFILEDIPVGEVVAGFRWIECLELQGDSTAAENRLLNVPGFLQTGKLIPFLEVEDANIAKRHLDGF